MLAACGGGTNGDPALVDAANAKETEASALASPTPCSSADQCGLLPFMPVSGGCICPRYLAYSLVSASAAAASAAATEQNVLAGRARAVSDSPTNNCFCQAPPRLACVGSLCQVSP